VRTFPLDGVAHHNFSGCLSQLAQYDRAAAEEREAIRLMPLLATAGYQLLMANAAYANRLDEAKVVFTDALTRKVDNPGMHDLRHDIAFLEHDETAMQEQLAWLGRAQPIMAAQREADVEAYYGRFGTARRLLQQTESSANTLVFRDMALQLAEAGDDSSAERAVREGTALRLGRYNDLVFALVAARTGNIETAERLADGISRESPQDTLLQYYSLPVIRAAIKLNQKDPAGAIEILRPAERYELAYTPGFNSVYPAYLRGLAYLQLGEGRAAVPEFQELLDHSAIVGRHVIGALAHLQIGRAQAMAGDKDAARKAYQDFLTLWKAADPDIPVYRQAKAEFAALQRVGIP